MSSSLDAAREAVEQGSESTVLNPRARAVRDRPRVQRQALSTLEHITVSVRDIAGTLEQAADPDDETLQVTDAFRSDVAGALHAVSDALVSFSLPDSDTEAAAKRRAVDDATAQVRRLHSRATQYEQQDAASLLGQGALIAELDLVMRELNRTPLYA